MPQKYVTFILSFTVSTLLLQCFQTTVIQITISLSGSHQTLRSPAGLCLALKLPEGRGCFVPHCKHPQALALGPTLGRSSVTTY